MLFPLLLLGTVSPGDVPDNDRELFEARVRPVLVERCYRCHNSSGTREAGLALDHAGGLLEGGRSGPALVPGDPAASLLLRAVRHEDGAPRMPRDEPKLEPHELEALEEWIRRGAPDPRDTVPSAEELAAETSWEAVRARRSKWWSFQPLEDPALPQVSDRRWARDDLDRFVLSALEQRGAAPAPEAGRATLLRRASFVLTGLPPGVSELEAFLADERPGAYERAVDRLLASPHYGERLARHWMDLFRYAETHGSEGDPGIPLAYRYRDYLVRAFEADVPWSRLVQEHLAGDLLPPRVDEATGVNDAALGLGHLRFVQHGYAPTEPVEEQIRFIDNQIDVIGKAFLGLTVSCARCHDHKFDPISQADFYALFGVLASVRPALCTVDSAARRATNVAELRAAKPALRRALAEAWLASLADLPAKLEAGGPALEEAGKNPAHPLYPWVRIVAAADVEQEWLSRLAEFGASGSRALAAQRDALVRWELSGNGAREWFAHGSVLDTQPAPPGAFAILPAGERVLTTVLPGGVYSHLLSDRHSGLLTSPMIELADGSLWVRAMGGGGARTRYSLEGYPRVAGPMFKAHDLRAPVPRWMRWDMRYWEGDRAYVELATARDLPVERRGNERSFWGVTEVRFTPAGAEGPRDEPAEFQAPLFEGRGNPRTTDELAERHVEALQGVIERWAREESRDTDVRFLDPFVRHGLVPVTLEELPRVAPLVAAYRELEAGVPVPVRAPGVVAGERVDQALFTRGDFRRPAGVVPQRFFEWIDPTPYAEDGRLALARDLVRADNPLTPRVAVNRLWTWVFGEGLVPTPDNLGLLGSEPRDAALLDHLASRFVADGWSARRMLRALVTSSTFRQQSPPRRLDAESLRDALLAVSGRLEPARFGGSVDERSARRSLYVAQRRGAPPAFLAAFDQPEANSTTGDRPVTNVPAQALALLNDPLVVESAQHWARRILATEELRDDAARIRRMVVEALGRAPAEAEVERLQRFLSVTRTARERARLEREQLGAVLVEVGAQLDTLLRTGRARVLEQRGERPTETGSALPEPIARWEFDGDLNDDLGDLHGTAHGDARVVEGRLVLGGTGFVTTRPLARELTAKTLEVWVALDDLDQRASGALTVQTTDGSIFDSIVFAERQGRRWMAGSDFFNRTQDVGGAEEAGTELVHVAITYSGGGEIALYREGAPYGAAYAAGGPVRYPAGVSQVLIGARHGTPDSIRAPLRGAIERAQLHDRALAPEEIAASAVGDPDFVSRAALMEAMTDEERTAVDRLRQRIATSRARRAALAPLVEGGQESAWRELGHALFQLEEFRYLR